jgi:hypothetical protein
VQLIENKNKNQLFKYKQGAYNSFWEYVLTIYIKYVKTMPLFHNIVKNVLLPQVFPKYIRSDLLMVIMEERIYKGLKYVSIKSIEAYFYCIKS